MAFLNFGLSPVYPKGGGIEAASHFSFPHPLVFNLGLNGRPRLLVCWCKGSLDNFHGSCTATGCPSSTSGPRKACLDARSEHKKTEPHKGTTEINCKRLLLFFFLEVAVKLSRRDSQPIPVLQANIAVRIPPACSLRASPVLKQARSASSCHILRGCWGSLTQLISAIPIA